MVICGDQKDMKVTHPDLYPIGHKPFKQRKESKGHVQRKRNTLSALVEMAA